MSLEANKYKCDLRALYEIYTNNFLYRYCLQCFDNKYCNNIVFIHFLEMRRDGAQQTNYFKVFFNTKIEFDYLLRYALLLEGENKGQVIKDLLYSIDKYKKDCFTKIVEKVVLSNADINSIIIYCNQNIFFHLFVKALPESLILSYYESIKDKKITSSQARFLISSIHNNNFSPDAKNKLADIFLASGEKNNNNLKEYFYWWNLLRPLLGNQNIENKTKEKLLNLIKSKIFGDAGKNNPEITDFLYSKFKKIINNKDIVVEIKSRLIDSFLNSIQKDLFQISLASSKFFLVRYILEGENIDKKIKNQLINVMTTILKEEVEEISDGGFSLLDDIFRSKNIEKNKKDVLLFSMKKNTSFKNLVLKKLLTRENCTDGGYYLLEYMINNNLLDKKQITDLISFWIKVTGQYYLINDKEFFILNFILNKKNINQEEKNKLFNAF